MKKTVIGVMACLLLCGCEQKNETEAKGFELLGKARKELAAKNYDAAKKQIEIMRDSVPLALNAREAGILLMDSIDLGRAQEQLRVVDSLIQEKAEAASPKDSLNKAFSKSCEEVKFFLRKLQHDKSNKKTYND